MAKEAKGEAGVLVVLGKAEGGDSGEHAEIRAQVLDLLDKSDQDAWALAAALVQVNREGLYHGWGFTSWREYVEKELDFHIRKAQQLIKTEEWLCTLPKNVQAWFRSLTYTKARLLTNIVTPENAKEWQVKIEGRTVMEIDKILHDDAVEKREDPEGAGADAGTERQPKLGFVVSPPQRANIMRALEVCAKAAGCDTTKDRMGYLLDLICTEYLATNGFLATVQEYLANVEAVIGLQLVAYDQKKDEIVYGGDNLDAMGAGQEEEGDLEEEEQTVTH